MTQMMKPASALNSYYKHVTMYKEQSEQNKEKNENWKNKEVNRDYRDHHVYIKFLTRQN